MHCSVSVHSIFHLCVTCCDLDVTIRLSETAQDSNSMYHQQQQRQKNKSGTSGCGLFVVPYFQPATSTNRLHLVLMSRIGSREAKQTSQPITVTAMEVKGKEHDGLPDKQEEELHTGGLVPGLLAAQDKL